MPLGLNFPWTSVLWSLGTQARSMSNSPLTFALRSRILLRSLVYEPVLPGTGGCFIAGSAKPSCAPTSWGGPPGIISSGASCSSHWWSRLLLGPPALLVREPRTCRHFDMPSRTLLSRLSPRPSHEFVFSSLWVGRCTLNSLVTSGLLECCGKLAFRPHGGWRQFPSTERLPGGRP